MTGVQTCALPISFLRDNFKDIINYKSNSKKLESLQDENEKLKEEVIALNNKLDDVQSLDSLKKALNYIDEKYQAKSISTSVVGKNDGNWYDSFVIGAGRKQGVKDDSIVINGNGLVGIVYEVSDNYSKAISLLDTKSSVSFKLLKDSNLKGVITQNSTLDDKENYKNLDQRIHIFFNKTITSFPLFKTFNFEEMQTYCLPRTTISYRNTPEKSILGIELEKMVENFFNEVLSQR